MIVPVTCSIYFQDLSVDLTNMQFSSLVRFALEVANRTARDSEETHFATRMERLRDDVFFPGRGFEIEGDFSEIAERKFWARVFLETARWIFERRIGDHSNLFWQAQCIRQAYGIGELFVAAVQTEEPRWFPDTSDRREFQAVVNGKNLPPIASADGAPSQPSCGAAQQDDED